MDTFSYEAPVGTVKVVPFHPFYGWLVYKVYVNDKYLTELQFSNEGTWIIPHPIFKEFYYDDILAIADQIEERPDFGSPQPLTG